MEKAPTARQFERTFCQTSDSYTISILSVLGEAMASSPISSSVVDFALGAALITLPQYKLPLAAGAAAVGLARRVVKRKTAAQTRHSTSTAHRDRIHLSWSDLTCTLTDKKGRSKQLLKGLAGDARPGRCARARRTFLFS